MRIALRSLGWLLIAAGAVVALYLVYSLYWTGLETSQAQDRLMQEFEDTVGRDVVTADLERGAAEGGAAEGGTAEGGTAGDSAAQDDFSLDVAEPDPLPTDIEESEDPTVAGQDGVAGDVPDALEVGAAVGVMEFHRPSAPSPGSVVVDDPLVVVESVTVDALKAGPGRYPGTAQPGQVGNFAVAGHRTTYGAPFWDLDQLREGDEIHVTDRNGVRWVYEYLETRIVAPEDVSVIGEDPLGLGTPMLTLTTCHPRWSQTERLIVFARLAEDQVPLARAA